MRYWRYRGESFDRIMEDGLGDCLDFVCAAGPWDTLKPIVPERWAEEGYGDSQGVPCAQ